MRFYIKIGKFHIFSTNKKVFSCFSMPFHVLTHCLTASILLVFSKNYFKSIQWREVPLR